MLELMLLFGGCLLLGLVCLGAAGWVLVTPEEVGVERLFLLFVCLLLGLTFWGLAAWMARYTPLYELWKKKPAEASAAPAEAPSPSVQKKEEPAGEEAGKAAP